MVKNRKQIVPKILLFLTLVIFPFGQLLRFHFTFLNQNIVLLPIDFFVGVSVLYFLFKNKSLKLSKGIIIFITYLVFSYILILDKLIIIETIKGLLYALRLISFIIYFYFVSHILKQNNFKELIRNSCIAVVTYSAIFGWIQYFMYPNLRFIKYIGWDEHLYRLSGTFLDPNFLGIIIVLGIFMLFKISLNNKSKKFQILMSFLIMSLAFTYSRSSYLAFFAGTLSMIRVYKWKTITGLLAVFLLLVILLPRPGGEGVRLERTASIEERINYQSKGKNIFLENPLFGVGYNNICSFKTKYYKFNEIENYSHSCSGMDSSILLLFSTLGVVGVFMLFKLLTHMYFWSLKDKTFQAMLIAVITHSLFVNSMVYPWVMLIIVLYGATIYKKKLNIMEYRNK